jgi:hypothetical protein
LVAWRAEQRVKREHLLADFGRWQHHRPSPSSQAAITPSQPRQTKPLAAVLPVILFVTIAGTVLSPSCAAAIGLARTDALMRVAGPEQRLVNKYENKRIIRE